MFSCCISINAYWWVFRMPVFGYIDHSRRIHLHFMLYQGTKKPFTKHRPGLYKVPVYAICLIGLHVVKIVVFRGKFHLFSSCFCPFGDRYSDGKWLTIEVCRVRRMSYHASKHNYLNRLHALFLGWIKQGKDVYCLVASVGIIIHCIVKWRTKLLIHSQISKVQPLKFRCG